MKMNKINYKNILAVSALTAFMFSCSLDEKLNDSIAITPGGTSSGTAASFLTAAYNNLAGLFHSQDLLFSLEETTSDEALIPTRGGDWDDNGVWRVLHAHAWDATHTQSLSVFNGLGKMESDALTVLAFNPSTQEAAEAYFLRSMAQFYYLDLYGQVPYRTVEAYNGIEPAPVMSAAQAVDTLVTTLRMIIPQLRDSSAPYRASPDAARFLLMKVLLNKGAFLNKVETPEYSVSDMAEVIQLGQAIMNSGRYSLNTEFFDNFSPLNATKSTEMILAFPNNGTSSNNGISNAGINAMWSMTLHYNSDVSRAPDAGWNGFTTVADFYNTFGAGDTRAGGYPYAGLTDVDGLRTGFLVGQQYDQNGNPLKDRKGNPLSFTPEVSLIETDPNTLETRGIRVLKYLPDMEHWGGPARNQKIFFRYADVVLMVAEAQLVSGDAGSALTTVNALRSVRGASALASLSKDELLAERGRELYWESWRRQDLIRFGAYLKPWALKETDDPKYLLFPIPSTQLVANPNLAQNPGY